MDRINRLALFVVGGLALSTVPVAPVLADVVRLKDGTQIEGDIKRSEAGDGWVIVGRDGSRSLVPFDKVRSIEATAKTGGDAAERGLASLRRAAGNSPDIRQTIDRYKAFIAQHAGSPAADKAAEELKTWQDRLDRGMVKLGDKWVTAEEKTAVEEKSASVARDLLELLRQGQLRKAGPLLDKALAENPQSAALWYLKGVALYRQDQLQAARKAFESAEAILPDHAPTLNNLAVVLWRVNAQVGALNKYDKALLASPASREVLDNLAEALNALPEGYRDRDVTKKVVRRFNEQDLALQAKMRDAGMFRWGATWVSAADLERLLAAEREMQARLGQLNAEFEALAAHVASLESRIQSYERLLRRLEAESYGTAADGRPVRYPLPPSYYTTVSDVAAMRAERAGALARQEALRREAKRVQQDLPIPRYAGLQRLIDVEGTPLPPTPPPLTNRTPTAAPPDLTGVPPLPAAEVPPTGGEAPPTTIPPRKPTLLDRGADDPGNRDLPPGMPPEVR